VNSAESSRTVVFTKSPLLSNLIILYLLLAGAAIGGSAVWLLLGRKGSSQAEEVRSATAITQDAGGIKANPGPWGDLYYVPFTISAPENLLPVRSIESRGTHWFFKNWTHMDLESLVSGDDVSASLRAALLAPTSVDQTSSGLDVTPPDSVVMGLKEGARKRIYQTLARFPENRGEIHFISKNTLEDRFKTGEVSEDTMRIFQQLCCEHGDYLVFAGLATMLSHLPSYEAKVSFVRALTRQKTMLLQIHQKPDTDVVALANYWGKGSRATDVRTVLESLSKVQGGAWVNILMMIPPLPASQLYTYPNIQDNPLNGPAHVRDCHWTSFNFFRDTPELDITPDFVIRELKNNYAPASGDPRYGDVVLFSKPDGDIIHSSIYLADDIVYTKNGATSIYPWMLATISDLMKQYSFQVPEGQKLTVAYYRQKAL
jgi:hypothetical protein